MTNRRDFLKQASMLVASGVVGSSILSSCGGGGRKSAKKSVTVYDLLLENTSPNHVFFQNDVFWTIKGGFCPVEYLKKYPQRIKTLHIKDEKAIGASGTIDFKAIFDQAKENGIKDWYVEVEQYDGTPQEDVQASIDFLKAADYVVPKTNIGLQLYSLREDVRDLGIQKVLEVVAQMGYVNLETAGYNDGKIYGIAPAEFKKMVNDLGMKVTSAHVGRSLSDNRDEDMAWWNKAIEAHASAGMKYMVMPWSPLDGEGATMDNVKRYCDYFNAIGLITAGASIAFGYHNHAFEFTNTIEV